jgi:hypothetical protein
MTSLPRLQWIFYIDEQYFNPLLDLVLIAKQQSDAKVISLLEIPRRFSNNVIRKSMRTEWALRAVSKEEKKSVLSITVGIYKQVGLTVMKC